MNWSDIIQQIENDLLSRELKCPRIRIEALKKIDKLLVRCFPCVRSNPELLLQFNKSTIIGKIAILKPNGTLNSAEKSVLNNIYSLINSRYTNPSVQESHSSNSLLEPNYSYINKDSADKDEHKLLPIAKMISEMLEEKFGVTVAYEFEVKKSWLPISPLYSHFKQKWKDVETIYYQLVDKRWTLESRLKENSDNLNFNLQKIDVWFAEPYRFIFEFDEPQHFNQFRLSTLNHYDSYLMHSFNFEQYKTMSAKRVVRPGTSGFYKLKSVDPLFPEMYIGEKQDNRLRQRAFRDFLKDIVADIVGLNPTIRMSYKDTNGKINNFSVTDIEIARKLIQTKGWLNRIVI